MCPESGVRRPGLKDPAILPAAALAAAAAGQVFLYCFRLVLPGIIFFIAAAALLVMHDRSGREEKPLKIPLKTEMLIFALIVIIAAVFRLAYIDRFPAACFTDEAALGIFAKNMLENGTGKGGLLPVVLSGWTRHPCPVVYLIAAVFKIAGIGATQIRVVSAVLGTLAVPALYFLIRYLMGPLAAITAGLLLAVMRWHVNFSRIGFDSILSVTLAILALYFVMRAYRERKWRDFALAGFTIAASQYTYVAARLVFAWLAIICAYVLIKDRGFFRENMKKTALGAAIALAFLAPLGKYFLANPSDLLQRPGQVFIFNKDAVWAAWGPDKSMAAAFLETVFKTPAMFNVRGDDNGRHNLPGKPMLDFFTGMAALAGFLYILYRAFKPEYFFFISFFAVFLAPGLLTIEAPQALRTIMTIPAVLFFAVVFINKVLAGVSRKPALAIAGLSLVLLASGAENAYIYFGPQAHSAECRKAFSQDVFEAAQYAEKAEPGTSLIVYDRFIESSTFQFLAGDRIKDCEIFVRDSSIPLRPEIKTRAAYLLSEDILPFAGALKEVYPGAEIYRKKDPYSGSDCGFVGVKIPARDVENWNAVRGRHGLTGRYYKGLNWAGPPVSTEKRQLMACSWNWVPAADPSSAEWMGKIKTEVPGIYSFLVQSRDYADLFIDGKKIVENPGVTMPGYRTKLEPGAVRLNKGLHSIRLRQSVKEHYYRLFLWWVPPGGTEKKLVPPDVLYYH
jgi:4-amino-4-deoxy-L-arabinose transferase-like glycosyltransferase